ncbi:MAG: glycosyltransferase family 4 protein [Verrucomicrobiae bacterium]|nr:glycosyltransferase family 4 protein [Verrucomicrobiae bacterium]MCP5539315.1 glycosyltransferase family 4 protein [Akkermansiaceae bacterium]
MKIGLIRRGYSETGGAERYLLRFADGLEALGHSCVLFSDRLWPVEVWKDREAKVVKHARSPGAFADSLEQMNPGKHCDFLFSLERVWGCDCYRAGDGVHAAWLDRRAAFEAKWRGLARGLNSKHRELIALERALYSPESRTHIIANADFIRKEIQHYYRTPDDRITVIHNGFDPPDLDAAARARLRDKGRAAHAIGPDTVVFLFVGSGWERKGLAQAIRAVERLSEEGNDVRLLVAGRDKGAPDTRVPSLTWFLGPASATELAMLYETADVFLLPTWYDPFSNASLEAAGHGLPVVTTVSNGICELWPDLEGSVVSSPEDPGLVDACRTWLDPEPRLAARPRNRAACALHSVAKNVQRSLDLFARLTGGAPAETAG